MQPPSKSAVEAGSTVQAVSNWTWGHSRVTWHATHLLHVSSETFWTFFVAAAPPSSDVARVRHLYRHGISEDRHVTIVEEKGERPATRDPTTVWLVPYARDVLVDGSMKR
jgi:hypothetical protein